MFFSARTRKTQQWNGVLSQNKMRYLQFPEFQKISLIPKKVKEYFRSLK